MGPRQTWPEALRDIYLQAKEEMDIEDAAFASRVAFLGLKLHALAAWEHTFTVGKYPLRAPAPSLANLSPEGAPKKGKHATPKKRTPVKLE